MVAYAIRRLGIGVLTVVVVTLVLFLIMHSMPGDPIRMIADPRTPEHQLEILRARWGLDRPMHIQYVVWLSNIARGDFGTSISTRLPVRDLIANRLPYTLALVLPALLLRYLIGVTVGLVVAGGRQTWQGNILVVVSTIMRSVPGFWLGILLMLVFAVRLGWFPISGYSGPRSIVLPMLTLMLPPIADTARMTYSEVLDVMKEMYVTTARSKGLAERHVLVHHVLRNALIPVTVSFFLSLPWLIGGAVIVESVFGWPGMGRLLWRSITQQDLPVVQGVVVIIAVLTVLSNTLGDMMTGFLDPRIREGMETQV